MNIIYTQAAAHVLLNVQGQHIRLFSKKLHDGELYCALNEQLQFDQPIWIVANTASPAENILELLFILDIMQRMNASANIMLTYYGYARHDKPALHEAHSALVIARALQNYRYKRLVVVHPHSKYLSTILSFESLIPFTLFCAVAQEHEVDIVVAPDEGAALFAQTVAQKTNKEFLVLPKSRSAQKVVERSLHTFNVKNKKILIVDDIISTGQTMMSAAHVLKNAGASSIIASATHGLFTTNAYENLNATIFERIYITNSIAQHEPKNSSIIVLDIAPYLVHSMKHYGVL